MRPEAVYRMLTLLCTLVAPLPVGTTLGRLHLLWMLVSGQLLATRGAAIPGVSAGGLSVRAVRRAWAALGRGDWSSAALLARWHEQVAAEGRWQGHPHGGYHPLGGRCDGVLSAPAAGVPAHALCRGGRAGLAHYSRGLCYRMDWDTGRCRSLLGMPRQQTGPEGLLRQLRSMR